MRAFAAAVLIFAGAVTAPAQRGGGHGGMPGGRGGAPGGGRPGFGGHPGIARGHPGVVPGGTFITTLPPYRTYGSPSGFGNILSPGLGTLPPLTVFPFTGLSTFVYNVPSTFPQRFGATISGYPGYRGSLGEFPAYWPYPVYAPEGYGYGEAPPPNVTVIMPPQQPAPPVTINQQFAPGAAQPEIREYGPGGEEIRYPDSSGIHTYRAPSSSRPAPSADDIRFLIPLKDSSVYTAVAYWVEGDTLHYITPDGRHNQVSLDLVDRGVAERLNRGSKAEFRLPPAKK